MKIVFDGRMLDWTGIGRFSHGLLDGLQKIDQKNQYVVLMLKKDWNKWRPTNQNFTRQMANYQPYSLKEQIFLPLALYKLRADLVHFLAPNIPLLYLGPHLTTVHDLTLLNFKNIRRFRLLYELKYRIFHLVFARALKSSRFLITPSSFTKQQLVKRFYLPTEKIMVVPGSTISLRPIINHSRSPKEPFLLYVGNAYPYKNLSCLIKAFAIVNQESPELQLVLVGKNDWFYQDLKRQVVKSGLEKKVIFTGFVSDKELVSFYQQARLFIFPSLSEGFGLPGLEAMAYGTPVLAARASCLPEVLGNAAVYFDPKSEVDLARKILELWNNPKKLKILKTKGYQQIKKYSWVDSAKKTLKVYQRFDS